MSRRFIDPSLRRSLLVSALAVVAIATTALVVSLSTMLSLRSEMDRDANAFIEAQRIADQIVALTYQQQLESYRFLQQPAPARRGTFQVLGDEADTQMRQYLFHSLSPAARLQVERMKETHEAFEVSAQRAFDLAERGETVSARARLTLLDAQAASLDTAVTRFLEARVQQRAVLVADYRALTTRVRAGLVLVTLLLLTLAVAVAFRLRRQVVVPLEQLADAAQRIRHGDALARVPAQQHLELRNVALAFNEMADSMQLARETVEMQNEELRRSLDQLQETQNELVQHEKLSAMGQMLAGLAHELNNPLGGVLGMAELLRGELAASPDAAARRLGSELAVPLEREAVRARDLVRSLLNFARKATGRVEPVALATTVANAANLRDHAFVQSHKRMVLDIPAALQVMADAQKLQQAVVNVVNNALDAMIAGGGDTLTITARADGEARVCLDFDDEGPGFPDFVEVFSPFYTSKPAEKGTGLGLTLVRKFIEEFGGTVSASNRTDGGGRLTMVLRRAPDAVPEREAAAPAPEAAPVARGHDARSARHPRVLVVDDESSLREVQRRLLTLDGMDVLLAASSAEAREIIAREPLDLVVSDLRMPGDTDGLGLLAWLARDHPHLAARSLLVTGDVSGASATTYPVPAERLINKPFTRSEYLARIRQALDRDIA